jgi:predicted metalloprotease with PDZ domain
MLILGLTTCGGERQPAQTSEDAAPESPALTREAAPAASDRRPTHASLTTPDFRLRIDAARHLVRGEIDLELANPDTVHIQFRADWDGYPGLASRVRTVEAWSGSGALPVHDSRAAAGRRAIPVSGAGRVTVAYTLELTPPTDTRLYHRASQLSLQGGHLIGRDMLPRVWTSSGRGATPGHARIWFSGLPPSWRIATVARHEGNAYETDDIRDIVFALGPLRTRQFNIGPRAVTVAILGDWAASDERIFHALQSIAGNLHSIAGDGWREGPHLIIAGRVPAGPQGLATGGQVLGRTGLVYVGGTWPGTLGFERWLFTAAHELMHWYIPTAFHFREQPPSWFAEGFTDYMALKTLLVGGLIPAPQFLMEMGERIVRYQSSPLYGNTSMAEAQSAFWREDDYRFIYDGGSAAAFLLDLGFHDRRGSLERALRELSHSGQLDEERIVDALSTVRENEWLAAWLATGENPDWGARLRNYGMELQGGRLSANESWATDELSTIRP